MQIHHDLAFRVMRNFKRIPGVLDSESVEYVTPLFSPVHRGLQDSLEDLLDTSEDSAGQEASGEADESLDMKWEGSNNERKAWLRGQCDAI